MKRIFTIVFAFLIVSTVMSFAQEITDGTNANTTYKKSKNVHSTSYNNIFEMLRAEPGVMIQGASGGGTPKIYIRGISTNSDNTQPLFVVDGVVRDDISSILPNEVYKIEVIKDATSAIYGLRGANGVILVTTLTGRQVQEEQAAAEKEARLAAKQAKIDAKAAKKAAKGK